MIYNNILFRKIEFAALGLFIPAAGCVTSGSKFDDNDDNDPDELPDFIHEVPTEDWSRIIGPDKGILSAVKKLEDMYSNNEKAIKVYLVNNKFSEGNWHYEFPLKAGQSIGLREDQI